MHSVLGRRLAQEGWFRNQGALTALDHSVFCAHAPLVGGHRHDRHHPLRGRRRVKTEQWHRGVASHGGEAKCNAMHWSKNAPRATRALLLVEEREGETL